MSDEEQAGAEGRLVQQEFVMRGEDMNGEESGLVDTQHQVYFACGSQDILEFHPAEEGSDFGQVDWGKICYDIGDPEGEYVLDLPGDCLQGDLVGEGLPLLGLLPRHREVLVDGCAW